MARYPCIRGVCTPADDEADEEEQQEDDTPEDSHDDVEHRRPASGLPCEDRLSHIGPTIGALFP